ncbi:MAG: peptidase M1 [Flavobacterium sp. BFFFF1]|uniref:M1 family aminopeptidase n=1 Tax=Flavobacterium sp. BFFFF1 TaxID=2015557 RepID=UPI000BDCF38A|nr:M1 family aminopeptidase [Flavobacterium sp. BFFFF1]OYU80896.1 MAG: peptidase M1 [Flavobacterium sp. BFFFF1]
MKYYYAFILLFALQAVRAQKVGDGLGGIAEAEMKSAANVINFVVNPNTTNYDITYQKLEFNVDPAVYFIEGKVTTTFTALSPMNTVVFDLTSELTVSSVKRNNVALSFVQNGNNEVVITLPGGLVTGASTTVEISYSGQPASAQEAFTTEEHNGSPVLYTLSEPYGAQDWWPCKQDLNDKVNSIDVFITAPSQYVSVSNGKQIEEVINGNGTKTTHFRHNHPIPAYLVAIAVTNYNIYTQMAGTAPNQFPIVNYVYPEDLPSNMNNLAQTVPIMNLYEQLFETYPFADEKYGHAQFGWGGGMEHTTVSFMVSFGRGLIAHELGHQWFGDKITCGSWKDIWLNEGFATYLAALVIENFDGETAFTNEKSNMINNITFQPGGAVYLTDAETNSVNRIFSGRLSYNKGAMVINMLRLKLGDALFFQGLKNYLADPNLAYAYATTADLQAHLEAVYGQSLSEFFNDWVYNQGYPSYTINANNESPGVVKFVVSQTQSHSSVTFFEMPLPVRVFGAGGQQMDLVLENISNNQVFLKNVPFEVTSIAFDPNKNIISAGNQVALGMEDFGTAAVQLYPNPAENILKLEVPEGTTITGTDFYNTVGQKVKSTEGDTNWDVSGLSSGVYFIQITTNSGNKTIRFVKK